MPKNEVKKYMFEKKGNNLFFNLFFVNDRKLWMDKRKPGNALARFQRVHELAGL